MTIAASLPMRILHVVRRYGPVGGMERYVWELTRELARSGHSVHVVCEQLFHPDAPPGVKVHYLPRTRLRPRWLARLKFSHRVARWTKKNGHPGWIVHSHERCANHQVTTFHGPPFAPVREYPFWKRTSLRIAVNLWLEKRELSGEWVRAVVPCSKLIGERLRLFYPESANVLADPILPGIAAGRTRPPRKVPRQGGTIGFVGYEWQRKGLDIAIQIISRLRASRPQLDFWVAGPHPDAVKHLFVSYQGKHRLLGDVEMSEVYPQLDLLLHPARQEPFGMVVAEAMAAKVPVVISSDCGAQSEVTDRHGRVLSRRLPVEEWSEACARMLDSEEPLPGYARPWKQVAAEYEQLYRRISSDRGSPI